MKGLLQRDRSGKQRVAFVLLTLAAMFVTGSGSTASADHQQDRDTLERHCPDHQSDDVEKIENPSAGSVHQVFIDGEEVWAHVGDDRKSVEFSADEEGTTPSTVEFCLKAGDRSGGKDTGSSGHVSWENNGGQTPDISYIGVYDVADGPPPSCPGDDGTIDLEPSSAENPVNTDHEMKGKVEAADGDNCEDVNVRLEVDSNGNPDPSEGNEVTDNDGNAFFTFTNDTAGTDTITACTNADGSLPDDCDDADITDTATKTWVDNGPPAGLTCRANLVAAALAGNPLPNLFEANPPSDPCTAEQNGLLVTLSPLLGDGGLGLLNEENQIVLADPSGSVPGFILVDALWADTDTDGTTAAADSGILLLVINDGSADQIVVEVATSSSQTTCDGGTETTARVAKIFIGGEEILVPGEHTVLIAPELFDVLELHLEDAGNEGADEGPDDTGAQAIDLSALAGNVTAAIADSETGCG